jgi:predicted NACHT family NTPase
MGFNPATPQTPQFRDKYYEWLKNECKRYQTKGLSQIGNLPFSDVFVPLKIAVKYQDKASSAIIPSEGDNTNSQEERTIWHFLVPEIRSIVLLGAPGSGKTTLLKHLTFVYASKKQKDFCEQAPELIPVLLLIREVSQKIANKQSLSDLIADQAKHIVKENQTTQLSQWFSEELDQGKCLVMLDGLDEVADESQRKQVTNWVEEQRKRYFKNIFFLTYRPLALDAYCQTVDRFLEVQPFNDKQITAFVCRWYFETENIYNIGGNKRPEEIKTQAQKQAEDLIKKIENSRSLKAMLVNPLLLTMICTIHHKNRSLPEKLVELYKVMCEILLEKRQINGVSIKVQDKQSVLQVLALELMKKEDTKFELSDGIGWIEEQLATVASNHVRSETFIKHICEIGLLVHKEQYYQFAHLSFQEYLAACQIKKSNQESLLIKQIANSSFANSKWWEETILLYAAQSEEATKTRLIREIDRAIEQIWGELHGRKFISDTWYYLGLMGLRDVEKIFKFENDLSGYNKIKLHLIHNIITCEKVIKWYESLKEKIRKNECNL